MRPPEVGEVAQGQLDLALVVAHREPVLLHVDAALADRDDVVEPDVRRRVGLEGEDVDPAPVGQRREPRQGEEDDPVVDLDDAAGIR